MDNKKKTGHERGLSLFETFNLMNNKKRTEYERGLSHGVILVDFIGDGVTIYDSIQDAIKYYESFNGKPLIDSIKRYHEGVLKSLRDA